MADKSRELIWHMVLCCYVWLPRMNPTGGQGICVILCAAIGIVSTAMNVAIPGAGIMLGMIAVILTAVLDIAGEYYEFKAHAGVMSYVSQNDVG